jgi:hypothetical protein
VVLYDIYLNAFSKDHLELVDTVIDNLLQKHIYTVIALRTIAQLANVHTGAQTDVLNIAQVAYRVVAIIGGTYFIFVEFQIFIFGHIVILL